MSNRGENNFKLAKEIFSVVGWNKPLGNKKVKKKSFQMFTLSHFFVPCIIDSHTIFVLSQKKQKQKQKIKIIITMFFSSS